MLLLIPTVTFSYSNYFNNQTQRDYLLQIGLGYANITYPDALESDIDTILDLGVDRMTIYLDLTVGYAALPHTYLTVGVSGVGDRFSDVGSIQFNTYLTSVGFLTFPFKRGLYLGGEVGSTKFVYQEDGAGSISSEPGYGYEAKIGYDLDGDYDGFSISIASSYNYYYIAEDEVSSYSVYGVLNWK